MKKIYIVCCFMIFVNYIAVGQVDRNLDYVSKIDCGLRENEDSLSQRLFELRHNENLYSNVSNQFSGETLTAIQFPVGGIGSGCIQYDGNAVPRFWQIFNNMSHDFVPNSFLAIRTKQNKAVKVRALQTKNVNKFQGMEKLHCNARFPFMDYTFEDDLPVEVNMKVYNPFVPLDLMKSSIPAVFYEISIKNSSDEPVVVNLLASQQNAVGFSKVKKISDLDSFAARYAKSCSRKLVDGNTSEFYGGNKNVIETGNGCTALYMYGNMPQDDEFFGEMAMLMFDESGMNVNGTASWSSIERMTKQFSNQGTLPLQNETKPSAKNKTWSGALNGEFTLQKNEQKTIRIVLAWYFPNGKNGGHLAGWDSWGNGKWQGTGNYYANYWSGIKSLTSYITDTYGELKDLSQLFSDNLYATNVPSWVVSRIANQLCILKSRTIFHDKKGYVGLWEGCGAGDGSCAGNCNHVWHYAQAHARLFPELGRKLREQSYSYIKADGQLPYRQPAGTEAFDGQCGDILSTYREYLLCNNDEWMVSLYPQIKKAVNYLIGKWDSDEDGWLSGNMHTTYDCSMSGNPSFLSSMYAATLFTGAKMASICSDLEESRRWKQIAEKSISLQNQRLWNGEYFIQIPDSASTANDYVTGCHSDQLLGQWWADQIGLGNLYPQYRIESAYRSIFKYNFKPILKYHKQQPRSFAKDSEAAFLVTTWQNGDRPQNAPGYSDEIWPAYEYMVFSELLKYGYTTDALVALRSGYDRYDGKLKTGYVGDWGNFGFSGNPFGDDECGQFYGRSLVSWSALTSLQGFFFNGPEGILSFNPSWQKTNHQSFFTTSQAWGMFKQNTSDSGDNYVVSLSYGNLQLNELKLQQISFADKNNIEVMMNGEKINPVVQVEGHSIKILFNSISISKGDVLSVHAY